MKLCTKCKAEKPLDAFHKHNSRKDGLQSKCKVCQSIYAAEYYSKNTDKYREADRRYRENNPDKVRESKRKSVKKWRENNPDKSKEVSRRYYKNHPEAVNKWCRENPDKKRESNIKSYNKRYKANPEPWKMKERGRRSRKFNVPGTFTKQEWLDQCSLYDNRCVCCGKKELLTVDHVIPLTWDGATDSISNLQPLCKSCNSAKGNRHATDYRPAAYCTLYL